MSLTPGRDAVTTAVTELRRRHADALARNDAEGIGHRMSIGAREVILGGVADLLDRDVEPAAIWPQVGLALSDCLAGFLMTAAAGDVFRAEDLLSGALASIHELAVAKLHGRGEPWAVAEVMVTPPAGRT